MGIETAYPERFQRFHAALSGWSFEPAFADTELGADYWIIQDGGRGIGGLQRASSSAAPPSAGPRVYVAVDDLEAALDHVVELGGVIERPRIALGGDDRWFGTFRDSTGVSFGLWTEHPKRPPVPDTKFADPRIVPLYDLFEGDRDDLDAYVSMVEEFGADRILDVGCGTGVFALMLAGRGHEVTGVDPAAASLEVARAKPGAERVRFLRGDATTLPPLRVDLVTMTGNVAQVFLTDAEWLATLAGVREALRPGGRLVFETRDPTRRVWEEWRRDWVPESIEVPGIGLVESWAQVTRVEGSLVTFAGAITFPDGTVVPTSSTLRFREREEIEESLVAAGFHLDEVRDAPDRPGLELVFVASRL